MLVSVIVPLYHGKKYIRTIIDQAEANAGNVSCGIELLLVNDAPDDPINENWESDIICIRILNTKVNRGIHGTRVKGLQNAMGEYVLFLDQDDRIWPEYIRSQLDAIGTADAVVCRCIHEGKLFYNEDYPFEQIMNKEYMLTKGDPIISPGQVLIRKTSIPKVWKTNIMHTNCADDFLLWLCMVGEDRRFALNQEVLFVHTVEYDNTSWDSYRMTESEQEMVRILVENHVFSGEDVSRLEQMLGNIEKMRMRKLDKFRRMFYILKDWVGLREEGFKIGDYLRNQGFLTIAVYGAGYLGKLLIRELEKDGVHVRYLVDRNAAWISEDYPIYTLKEELQQIDVMIVTLVQGEEAVVKELEEKTGAVVYTIKQLVSEIQRGAEND